MLRRHPPARGKAVSLRTGEQRHRSLPPKMLRPLQKPQPPRRAALSRICYRYGTTGLLQSCRRGLLPSRMAMARARGQHLDFQHQCPRHWSARWRWESLRRLFMPPMLLDRCLHRLQRKRQPMLRGRCLHRRHPKRPPMIHGRCLHRRQRKRPPMLHGRCLHRRR